MSQLRPGFSLLRVALPNRCRNVFQTLLTNFSSFLARKDTGARWPERGYDGTLKCRLYEPPMLIELPDPATLLAKDRTLFAPRAGDHRRAERRLPRDGVRCGGLAVSGDEVLGLAGRPLAAPSAREAGLKLGDVVVLRTRAERGESAVAPDLPFDVRGHPTARAHVAAAIQTRLGNDARYFAEDANGGKVPELVGFTEQDVAGYFAAAEGFARAARGATQGLVRLLGSLRKLHRRDRDFVARGTEALLRLANHVDARPVGAHAGQEARSRTRDGSFVC